MYGSQECQTLSQTYPLPALPALFSLVILLAQQATAGETTESLRV